MTRTTVLMVIRTTGLAYDDRLRKECASVRRLGGTPRILALEIRNESGEGVTADGTPFRTIGLASRALPAGRALGLKTGEMTVRFLAQIRAEAPDVLWVHNLELAGLLPFGFLLRRAGVVKRVVWDQHELPPPRLFGKPWRSALGRIMARCDLVLVANEDRRSLLLDAFPRTREEGVLAIDNLSDRRFAAAPAEPLPEAVRDWLGGRPYLLAQGGGAPLRYLEQVVEAVMGVSSLKLVVVGGCREEVVDRLGRRWPSLDERVLFTGMVPQMEVLSYIDHAAGSVVLYDRRTANNDLCAPNRLHQAVSRGVPVIVGANPPLRRFVERTGAGVVLSGDGREAEDVRLGIVRLLKDRDAMASAARRDRRLWEDQDGTISRAIGVAPGPASARAGPCAPHAVRDPDVSEAPG